MARSRAFPSDTVGYPTAGAKTPASNSLFENSNAFAASPTWIGTIGVSLPLNWNPRFFNSRLKNFVLAQSFFRSFSPSGEESSVKAAWHAPTVAGGCELEKRNGDGGK